MTRVLVLCSFAFPPTGVWAQPAALPAPAPQGAVLPIQQMGLHDVGEARVGGGQAATAALFEQSRFWLAQNQPQRAVQLLERILGVEPDNIEALGAAIEAASLAGLPEVAHRHLTRLRSIAPNDPQLQQAEDMSRLLTNDAAALTAARQLASAGRQVEAAQIYRQISRDGLVPSAIAHEYYQVLAASSEAGYRQAIQELEARVAAAPNDPRIASLLALLLTYREETRSEGIDQFSALAAQPGIRETLRAPWKQALLWSGDDAETNARINDFLRRYPGEHPELQAKLRSIDEAGLTPAQQARLLAWGEVAANRIPSAEQQFQAALAIDAQDAEAHMGLAVIRKSQNRLPAARELLTLAVALAPDRREEFERSVGDLSGRGGANEVGPSALAWAALGRDDLVRADAQARRATRARGEERMQGELVLGLLALRRDEPAIAEQRYRIVLALRPRQENALQGLYVAIQRQGRFAEAEALARESGLRLNADARSARAAGLVENARRLDHPEQAIEQLRSAVAADPTAPWPAVDLIRRLKSRGDVEEARALERELERRTDAESSMAAALLAVDDERYGDAVALFERVPVRLLNPDMNRLAAVARREFQVRQVEDAVRARRIGALQSLTAMAGQRDPSGTLAPAVVRALARLDQPAAAVAAARAALATNPQAPAMARIELASALIQAQRPDLAQELTLPLVSSDGLSAEERRELNAVLEYEALNIADSRLAAGELDAAEAAIGGLVARAGIERPSANANLAMVRLLTARGQTAEARRIVEQVLEQEPRNQEARIALVDVSIAARDFASAQAALLEGAFFHSGDLRMTLAEARLARARGDQVGTLRLMETAAARRLAELRADGEVTAATAAAQAMSPSAAPGAAVRLTDSLTSQIAQELIRARDEAATWLQAGIQVHSRGGEGGTGRLTNITAPLEVSTPLPGGMGGRLTVGIDQVALRSGRLGSSFEAQQSFGTNPVLATPGLNNPAFTSPRSSIEGTALRLGYTRDNFRAEIGSTPLGFPTPTYTGVLEIVPQITERLRLRVTVDRAPETASLLSYAGFQQAGGVPSWSGVVRTGGRMQLEYAPNNRSGIYAGGGIHMLRGNNVVNNTRWETGLGGFYTVLRQPGQSVTIGVDLRYAGHERNASGFTFGHGGYFSPAQSLTATLQAEYRAQWGDWTFRGIGAAGWQRFRTASAPVFPTNAAYQAQIEALAAGAPDLFNATLPGQTSSGLAGSIFANLEYAISPNLRLGAAGRYERIGNYEDGSGFFYLRYRLDRPRADLAPLLANAPTPYPNVNDPVAGGLRGGAPELVSLPSGAARPTW